MTTPQAVTLDALGTLLELVDPVGGLRRELAARGVPVDEPTAARALRAEIAHYRAHCDTARDLPSLEALRDACAAVLGAALPAPAAELPPSELRAALLAALRFRPFDDVPAALAALRAAGVRLVVVSNWDVSLHGVLRDTGLANLLDGAVTSAQEGVAKPDPEFLRRGLALVGSPDPARVVHVGDDPATDVAGALAAGIVPVLLDRRGDGAPSAPGVRTIRSLSELADWPRAAR